MSSQLQPANVFPPDIDNSDKKFGYSEQPLTIDNFLWIFSMVVSGFRVLVLLILRIEVYYNI